MTREERIEDIKKNPSRHMHEDLNALTNCCISGGAVDTSLMQAHQDYVNMGSNGGQRCDVRSGPCACGAWH